MNASSLASAIEKVKEAIGVLKPKTTIADWMRSEGFDPDIGWVLVLPDRMRVAFPESCVWFSSRVDHPTVVFIGSKGLLGPFESIPIENFETGKV